MARKVKMKYSGGTEIKRNGCVKMNCVQCIKISGNRYGG